MSPAKYLNSPDTPLFNKGRLLYNHAPGPQARRTSAARSIAVEGYVDVIAHDVAGFANAVAPLGTALTEDQLALLWRFADEPILCFDGDKAGPPRRLPGDRRRPAEPRGRQVAALRAPARRAGPGRSRCARAGRPPSSGCCTPPGRSSTCSGRARPRPARSTRRSAAPALERRLREVARAIRDETLRRYYRDEIETRLAALIREAERRPNPPRFQRRRQGRQPRRMVGRRRAPTSAGRPAALPRQPALAQSALFIGGSAVVAAGSVDPLRLSGPSGTAAGTRRNPGELELDGRDRAGGSAASCSTARPAARPATPAMLRGPPGPGRAGDAAAELDARSRPGDRWMLDPHADPCGLRTH